MSLCTVFLDQFRRCPAKTDPDPLVQFNVSERFDYGQIGVVQAGVLPDDRDRNFLDLAFKPCHSVVRDVRFVCQRAPNRRHRWFASIETETIHDHFSQTLFLEPCRDRVDVTERRQVDDRVAGHATVQAYLVFEARRFFIRFSRII